MLWLCHDACSDNGSVIEAAAGWAGKCKFFSEKRIFFDLFVMLFSDRWQKTKGMTLRESAEDNVLPEAVRDNWDTITDFDNALSPKSGQVIILL